ncbi:MAG: hypothetical protein K0S23_3237 [Fluviicola sp.]|jgi:hypothetical protein|nr:hypothetical protein [Fluviicola sp.]
MLIRLVKCVQSQLKACKIELNGGDFEINC